MHAALFRFCVAVAGWIHRSDLGVIEYLLAENRVFANSSATGGFA